MDIEFPCEFIVKGTPVSAQAKLSSSREKWKNRVKSASLISLPTPYFATDKRLSVILYYLPDESMQGDIDNIVKPILDALSSHIYIDDRQIERVVVQKFEPANIFYFSNPTEKFIKALSEDRPLLYIRISSDIYEDLY